MFIVPTSATALLAAFHKWTSAQPVRPFFRFARNCPLRPHALSELPGPSVHLVAETPFQLAGTAHSVNSRHITLAGGHVLRILAQSNRQRCLSNGDRQ
jgi:hypothetical protein